MKFAALDWRNLSALYQDLADGVLDYRIANSRTLTLQQKDSLNVSFGALLSASETFANQALQQATADIEASSNAIQSSTHEAIAAVQSLARLQHVLNISVAAIGLAAALLAPAPGTVVTALGGLVDAIHKS